MDKSVLFIKMCDCDEIQKAADDFKDADDVLSFTAYNMPVYEGGVLVWLPRQDQIQEMAGLPVSAWGLFYGWVFSRDANDKEPWQYFDTGEKLWLAFYMDQKHSKSWDSKEEKWAKR